MTTTDAPWRLDAVELAALIRAGSLSSREAVTSCLARLEQVNGALNAVVLVQAEEALAAADAADAARRRGEALGPLHGVPVTTKINTDQKGVPTDNGLAVAKDLVAPADNPVIANLRKAGAVIVGRTNAPALSMRWFTDNGLHGLTRNPWHAGRTCGGSSGGAAAAVAAGIGAVAQGNDIGGSIRYPAYCCGVAGIRPTFGRVPSHNFTVRGQRSVSSHLMAVAGPLARRVRDLRLALAAMAGGDVNDTRWVDVPLQGPPPPRPIRVALAVDPGGAGVHPAVAAALRQAASWLEAAGYAVEEATPPAFAETAGLWLGLAMDDILANLGPVIDTHGDDGIRRFFGFLRAQRAPGELKAYLAALSQREAALHAWQGFLAERALLLMPVSTQPPFALGADLESAEATRRLIAAQHPLLAVSVLGLPAVSVPTGLHDGVPVGVQIVAGRYREDLCLDAAEVVEAGAALATPVDPVS